MDNDGGKVHVPLRSMALAEASHLTEMHAIIQQRALGGLSLDPFLAPLQVTSHDYDRLQIGLACYTPSPGRASPN